MSNKYILMAGQPVPCPDLATWAIWLDRSADRLLQRDQIAGVVVSTGFLGLDHRYGGGGPPVLWETMIFGGPHDQYQERYTSREDALEGHQKAVALARG